MKVLNMEIKQNDLLNYKFYFIIRLALFFFFAL